MNYDEIITQCLGCKTQHELENYLNELFKNYSFDEEMEMFHQFKRKVWQMVHENNLDDEVADYIGFSNSSEEAEIGFTSHLRNPEDFYAGILHWINGKVKQ